MEELKVRRSEQFAFVLALVLLTAVFTGCVRTRVYQYSDATAGQTFLSSSPDSDTAGLVAKWSSSPSEHDKIDYLLDRIAGSPYHFIRNGETHDGKEARQWFLYKMTHWVDHVESAQDFVARVASYSQKTGEPYLVEFPDGKMYTLKSVLLNELSHFETRLDKLRKPQDAISKPSQVSLSPTTVATNAVATSTAS